MPEINSELPKLQAYLKSNKKKEDSPNQKESFFITKKNPQDSFESTKNDGNSFVNEVRTAGVLAHKDSGAIRYPKTHSVFTPVGHEQAITNICSSEMVTKHPEAFKNFLRQINGKFVNNNLGGFVYNRGIAETFYNASGKENLKDLLIQAENKHQEEIWGPRKMINIADSNSSTGYRKALIVDTNHQYARPWAYNPTSPKFFPGDTNGMDWGVKPMHRIAKLKDDQDGKIKDFEVILFSGHGRADQSTRFTKEYSYESGINSDQDRLAIDMLCYEVGFEGGLAERCKAITNLTAPTKAEFERTVEKHAKSIKETGRQLLIIGIAHANSKKAEAKFTVPIEVQHLQGAQQFRIKFKDQKSNRDGIMEEDEYKRIMNKYLDGEDVIHVLSGCKIGGALTSLENNKEYFAHLA
jgi:hypothetical protein